MHRYYLLLIYLAIVCNGKGSSGLAAKPGRKRPKSGSGSGGNTGGATGFGSPKTARKGTYEPDGSPEMQRLYDFLKSNGAEISNVEVGFRTDSSTGMRGLYSTKNFNNKDGGQLLCKIPSDCALALSDPKQRGDDAPTVPHRGLNFLQTYWNDPVKRKEWSPYLDTLPQPDSSDASAVSTPDRFTDEEIDLLEFPRLVNAARERKKQIRKLAAERGIPLEELQYASWIDSSRSFTIALADQAAEDDGDVKTGSSAGDEDKVITAAGGITGYDNRGQIVTKAGERKGIRVLVPLLDMVNHHSRPNARLTILDPERDDARFALATVRPIAAGGEITIAYGFGTDSSVDLFLNGGFVPAEPNRVDTFMLSRGGGDCFPDLDRWTTTLEEDRAMMDMTSSSSDEDINLRKILAMRIKLKEAYKSD